MHEGFGGLFMLGGAGGGGSKVDFYGPTVPGKIKGHALLTYNNRTEKKFYNGEHGYCS